MKYVVIFSFIVFGILNINAQETVSDDVLFSMLNNGYSAPEQVSNPGSAQNTAQNEEVQISDSQLEDMLNGKAVSIQTQSVKQTPKQSMSRQAVTKTMSAQLPACTEKEDGKTVFSSTGEVYQCIHQHWTKG